MTELVLPEEMTVPEAEAKLASALSVMLSAPESAEQTFYDTFDGRLHAAGVTLRHQDGRLALLDVGAATDGAENAAVEIAARPERLMASDLEPGPFRAALAKLAEVRALLPVAVLRTERSAARVLDANAKTVVQIEFEQPSVIASAHRELALRPRVRTVGLRGYDDELAAVEKVLVKRLGVRDPERPLVDEAVAAAGRPPAGVSARIEVPLLNQMRSDTAAVAVLARLLEVVEVNLPGTIADIDAEYLHDLRVAVRRSRSVQRELQGVFPSSELPAWRAEFRWLQQVTGPARDMDVYVLDFEEFRGRVPEAFQADLDPLLTVLRGRRLGARRMMVRELRSDRAAAALAGWRAYLVSLEQLALTDRPDATRPIASLAAERIRKLYRRMLRMGGAIDASSPAEAYHELRKKGKELRYMLELFGAPLFDPDVVTPMVKSLKSLQDTLGRHQDREVQIHTLRSLTGEVSALPGGERALMAMGLLVERLGRDERAARDEFAGKFEVFSAKPRRRAVAQTFGPGAGS